MANNENKEFKIEDAFDAVEKIVAKMEEPETGLEESFKLYKMGCEQLKKCSDAISLVEKELVEI